MAQSFDKLLGLCKDGRREQAKQWLQKNWGVLLEPGAGDKRPVGSAKALQAMQTTESAIKTLADGYELVVWVTVVEGKDDYRAPDPSGKDKTETRVADVLQLLQQAWAQLLAAAAPFTADGSSTYEAAQRDDASAVATTAPVSGSVTLPPSSAAAATASTTACAPAPAPAPAVSPAPQTAAAYEAAVCAAAASLPPWTRARCPGHPQRRMWDKLVDAHKYPTAKALLEEDPEHFAWEGFAAGGRHPLLRLIRDAPDTVKSADPNPQDPVVVSLPGLAATTAAALAACPAARARFPLDNPDPVLSPLVRALRTLDAKRFFAQIVDHFDLSLIFTYGSSILHIAVQNKYTTADHIRVLLKALQERAGAAADPLEAARLLGAVDYEHEGVTPLYRVVELHGKYYQALREAQTEAAAREERILLTKGAAGMAAAGREARVLRMQAKREEKVTRNAYSDLVQRADEMPYVSHLPGYHVGWKLIMLEGGYRVGPGYRVQGVTGLTR
ncbi:hypothetical protein HYH03_001964 [Edaphochlamys debaryana]|uniref:Uncharacterized protein n=1 Tax=Edaphochlamys debaryana TaxID=47281 RepID=A0A835YEU5_9CHLO|nr:hypothetical protein HYH03_001964 [Edaphochlamys debaryana]|eukprot:KAG2500392.1 hypothetical protein HYH03_001964 [Edaphochlamys debaryana]